MSSPPKRTQWREDLQNFSRDHGFSKKVLLDCCLVRRVLAWAAPSTKGRHRRGVGRFPGSEPMASFWE